MQHVPLLVLGVDLDGLVAALVLAHQGFPVHLLDRGPDPASGPDPDPAAGGTVVLPPHAAAEMATLGLLDALAAGGVEPERLVHSDARTGRPLRETDLGSAVRARYGRPHLVLGQGELRRVLAAACAADEMITVEHDVHPTIVDDIVEGALVGDETGPAYRAEALVAADGPGSRVRSLLGGGGPTSPPYVVHRAVWPAVIEGPAEIRTWSSPLLHAVRRPDPDGGGDLQVVVRADLAPPERRRLADHHVPELREGLRAALADPAVAVAHHHWPLERWTRHRITVLGAAAAPVLPHNGQAFGQAVLDGVALASAFDRFDGRVLESLHHYERTRAPARARAGARAEEFAGLCHADGLARRLRDRLWGGPGPDPLAEAVDLT